VIEVSVIEVSETSIGPIRALASASLEGRACLIR